MKVSACLVTSGEIDLQPVIDSLLAFDEIVVWDNGAGCIWCHKTSQAGAHIELLATHQPDLSNYGRYAAIKHASNDLIYTQDDDVIASDPQAIVDELSCDPCHWTGKWNGQTCRACNGTGYRFDQVAANMPRDARWIGYTLVALGSCFHRDLPRQAFEQVFWGGIGLGREQSPDWTPLVKVKPLRGPDGWEEKWRLESLAEFNRHCDIFFTVLSPTVCTDIPITLRELPEGWDPPNVYDARKRMFELANTIAATKGEA